MTSIHALFTEDQRRHITRAVTQAESRTAAEILPVVARASGRYDRAEDVAGLWLGAILMIVVWQVIPPPRFEPGHWGPTAGLPQLPCMLAALVIGFLIGAVVASRCAPLRRLFTPRRQMREEVQVRARVVFFDQRIHHTVGASGMLIYVSLYERLAAVLADQATLDKLGPQVIESLCDELTARLRQGDITEALCAAIALSGEKLAVALPRQEADVNELADALVVID